MSQTYITRWTEDNTDGIFVIDVDLHAGETLDFLQLADLKEQVDALFSEEQSRLLSLELAGDLLCDGCTI